MHVKVFDEESELDLQEAINAFLDVTVCDIIDIKYQIALAVSGEEQIYCFSAMVIYY